MSSSTVDEQKDILDVYRIKKTPEIYPMTSMHETMEYFHEKLNHLSTRAYENSATIQRLGEQLQQMSTRAQKPAASSEKTQASAPVPAPAAPVQAEKPDVFRRFSEQPAVAALFRRFSEQPAAPAVPEPVASVDEFAPLGPVIPPEEPEVEADPESDIEPERPDMESIHFRRFSEQQLESAKKRGIQTEADPDELDVSPCLWGRLAEKFHFEPEPESEPVQELDAEPEAPVRAQASALGLKRLSLCMMPPDAMQDVLDVISPTPTPSPAIGAAAEPTTSLFLR